MVTEDQSGNLWIGTREGLNKYSLSTGNIESYASGGFSGDMKHSSIFALYLDKEGGLWVEMCIRDRHASLEIMVKEQICQPINEAAGYSLSLIHI